MKNILFVLAFFLTRSAFGQGLAFEIKPYIVNRSVITEDTSFLSRSDTCTSIRFIIGLGAEDSAVVNYYLFRSDGTFYESGEKKVPKSVVSIVTADPINITYLNAVLSYWHIEAIRQKEY